MYSFSQSLSLKEVSEHYLVQIPGAVLLHPLQGPAALSNILRVLCKEWKIIKYSVWICNWYISRDCIISQPFYATFVLLSLYIWYSENYNFNPRSALIEIRAEAPFLPGFGFHICNFSREALHLQTGIQMSGHFFNHTASQNNQHLS